MRCNINNACRDAFIGKSSLKCIVLWINTIV
jgi:hypothetical protein